MATNGVEYIGRKNKVSYFCTGKKKKKWRIIMRFCRGRASVYVMYNIKKRFISWKVIIKVSDVSIYFIFFCKLQLGFYMRFLSQFKCSSKIIRIKNIVFLMCVKVNPSLNKALNTNYLEIFTLHHQWVHFIP